MKKDGEYECFFLGHSSRPQILFEILLNCVLALQNTAVNQWDPHARKLTVFVMHNLFQLCAQQRLSRDLISHLLTTKDTVQRYLMLCTVKRGEQDWHNAPYY